MASRTLSASLSSTKTCQHEDSAVFSSSVSADAAVSNAKCVGGSITFSDFRGWGKSYYFVIFIDGVEACETREINDQDGTTHELTTYIDTDVSINSDALLKGDGNIEVVVIDNTSPYTDDVCSFRDGCEITIKASYEAITGYVGAPSGVKLAETLSSKAVRLSWSAGSAATNNSVTGYDVQYAESTDGSTWGSWTTANGSPASGTSIYVDPPATAGHYRKFRVRTRGSAGTSYYSGWVESSNKLRKGHEALEGFTDSPLTAGMYVKALHMTELHDRVNTLRAFYGLSAYAFSRIDARGIAGWTDHVNEIKEAIEDVCAASGKTHEAWISFSVNCPRADVIEQLRAAVLAL